MAMALARALVTAAGCTVLAFVAAYFVVWLVFLGLSLLLRAGLLLVRENEPLRRAADWAETSSLRQLVPLAAGGLALMASTVLCLGGYYFSFTVTGSMWPGMGLGCVYLSKYCDMDEVSVGDIVSYYNPNLDLNVIHRVIRKDVNELGEPCLEVRGDANWIADGIRVTEDLLRSKTVWVGPTLIPDIRAENLAVYFLNFRLSMYNNMARPQDEYMGPELETGDLMLAGRCGIDRIGPGDMVVYWDMDARLEGVGRVSEEDFLAEEGTFWVDPCPASGGFLAKKLVAEEQVYGKAVKIWKTSRWKGLREVSGDPQLLVSMLAFILVLWFLFRWASQKIVEGTVVLWMARRGRLMPEDRERMRGRAAQAGRVLEHLPQRPEGDWKSKWQWGILLLRLEQWEESGDFLEEVPLEEDRSAGPFSG